MTTKSRRKNNELIYILSKMQNCSISVSGINLTEEHPVKNEYGICETENIIKTMEVNIMTKTQREIIAYRRLHDRKSFLGNTLEDDANIRRGLIDAINVLHRLLGEYKLSSPDELVLRILEEIVYPKSRQDDHDEIRDPDGVGIDILVD